VHRLKAVFISAFMMLLMAGLVLACWRLWQPPRLLADWALLSASAVPMLFFMRLFLGNVARTGRNLVWMPIHGAACTGLAAWAGPPPMAGLVAVLGLVLPLIYIHWYSRFGTRAPGPLAVGQPLPDFILEDLDGRKLSAAALTVTPALWLFFRGNWCPLCMAQIKEIAAQYRELDRRGVQVLLISPQHQAHSAALSQRFEAPMRFLRDVDNRAARQLGILAEGGLPMGMQALGYDSDVPMPTALITDTKGVIVYSDLTDDYRIRPEPSAFLAVIDHLGLAPA
jgi:peroxiredoxin